jgi:lipoic acid synthetase
VSAVLRDAAGAGARIVTIGQYLRPSPAHLPVARFVHPDEFRAWKLEGETLGIGHVESGPLVRSSYHADGVREQLGS